MQFIVNGIRILGSGSSLPGRMRTNNDLRPDTSDWVEDRLGIVERSHINPAELLLDSILEASKIALDAAGISAQDLDFIIIATSTPDYINPSTASIIHGLLGAKDSCASFDLQAVCAGFVYALSMVASYSGVKAGRYFLVIGADQFSKITDFDDRNCVFFGDAAAAMVIESTESLDSYLALDLHTDGFGWESFHTPKSTSTFSMNSKEVALSATTKLPASIQAVCNYANVKVSDIQYFVTHQPSKPVLDKLEETLEISEGRLLRNIKLRGNTAGATIPLLFDELQVIKMAKPGDLICFSAIGAGWVWGSAILKWE